MFLKFRNFEFNWHDFFLETGEAQDFKLSLEPHTWAIQSFAFAIHRKVSNLIFHN